MRGKTKFKPIPHYPEYSVNRNGDVRGKYGKLLSPDQSRKTGYNRVVIYSNGSRLVRNVHRLVAITFIPQVDRSQKYVNHKNGNKTDNRVKNLEWVSPAGNMEHKSKMHPRKTWMKAVWNMETGEQWESVTECAKAVGKPNNEISMICRGEIPGPYLFLMP